MYTLTLIVCIVMLSVAIAVRELTTFLFAVIILVTFVLYKYETPLNEKFTVESRPDIPKVIYMTSKNYTIPRKVMKRWERLNPSYTVELYDDQDCKDFLLSSFGQEYVDTFEWLKPGILKADFWRCCILYRNGGIYTDVDVVPIKPLSEFVDPDTSFMTCLDFVRPWGRSILINPHFIISEPRNIVLQKCIDKYLEMNRKRLDYSYSEMTIVSVMGKVLADLEMLPPGAEARRYKDKKWQYIAAEDIQTLYNMSFKDSKGEIVMYNRYDNYNAESHKF